MGDNRRHGGQILVDQLKIQGADVCFGVPGESYLAVLDGFHDVPELKFVICRQEGGVAMMAEAYGKLTGRPGVAFVTRGPGATNASAGVHIAQQDSSPMILFIGQIDSATAERDAFQEVDYRQMFGGIAKWVAEIRDVERIPEYVHRAFMTATAGRPGPVVLSLPEDMLMARAAVADAKPWVRVESYPAQADIERLRGMLASAKRPMLILGGSGWTSSAVSDIRQFIEAHDLPTACGFRRQDLLSNDHENYVGDIAIAPNPELAKRIKEADLLLVLGSRLSEMTTQGYTLLGIPEPGVPLVHVHADPEELGRVYQAALPIRASMPGMTAALRDLVAPATKPWTADRAALRRSYLAWLEPKPMPGAVQLGEIMAWLGERLPPDAIVTNGAGNYCGWVNRFYRYRHFRSQLAPTSGSMGYGLPAAIAAKLVHPERPTVCFAGDGCFLMTGQELATAVQFGLAGLVVIVVNNGIYGTIRMHQEREFPARVSGTTLHNPDFAAYARAFGAWGATVERTEDFRGVFDEAMRQPGPALIEVRIDADAITPRMRLSEIREKALAGR